MLKEKIGTVGAIVCTPFHLLHRLVDYLERTDLIGFILLIAWGGVIAANLIFGVNYFEINGKVGGALMTGIFIFVMALIGGVLYAAKNIIMMLLVVITDYLDIAYQYFVYLRDSAGYGSQKRKRVSRDYSDCGML